LINLLPFAWLLGRLALVSAVVSSKMIQNRRPTLDLRCARPVFAADAKRAFLVNSDVTFGFARMFEMLRGTLGEKGIQVFRNLDDALEWVLPKNSAV